MDRAEFLIGSFDKSFDGTVLRFDEVTWFAEIICDPDVDRTGAHTPFGISPPERVFDGWAIGLCVPAFLRIAADADDDQFMILVQYWLLHTMMHCIVRAQDQEITQDDLELEVEERLGKFAPDVVAFTKSLREIT